MYRDIGQLTPAEGFLRQVGTDVCLLASCSLCHWVQICENSSIKGGSLLRTMQVDPHSMICCLMLATIGAKHIIMCDTSICRLCITDISDMQCADQRLAEYNAIVLCLQALRCADGLDDGVVRAGCLTHLGSVLVASDADTAIKYLEEAVQLREDQVLEVEATPGSATLCLLY